MYKINIFIDKGWELTKKKHLNPYTQTENEVGYHNYTKHFDEAQTAYEAIFEQICALLQIVKFDFYKLNGLRVVVFKGDKKVESVNFKLADNGQIGVFANWKSLPNVSTQMWGVWTKLNNLFADIKEAV